MRRFACNGIAWPGETGDDKREVTRDIRVAFANKTIAVDANAVVVAAQMRLQQRKKRQIEEEKRKAMRIALKSFYGRRW